jgi:8-oxo-dGTP diphosphatase
MAMPVIDVAVCVVETPDGKVLLAERTSRQLAAGFWELPGGKIEPGETPAQAAARELQEETGLNPVGLTPWLSYEHQFPTKRLRLHFFRARGWQGTPQGREGQRLAWANPAAPQVGPILPSNDRALFALALPDSYVVADFAAPHSQDRLLATLHGALSGGASLVRLRLSSASPGQIVPLLARVASLAGQFPGTSVLTTSIMHSRHAALAGVHSCTRELRRLTARPPVRVWAATCHDDADLARAVSLGADFVVLSPILADPDRPHQAPIGWEGLRRCTAAYGVPIYAHGGLEDTHASAARQAGAAGLVLNAERSRTTRPYHAMQA